MRLRLQCLHRHFLHSMLAGTCTWFPGAGKEVAVRIPALFLDGGGGGGGGGCPRLMR